MRGGEKSLEVALVPLLGSLENLGGVKDRDGHLCASHDVQQHVLALIALVALGEEKVRLVDECDVSATLRL